MADAFTPTFNLTLPEVGASFDTWGTKLNNNLSEIDKFMVPPGGIIMWSGAIIDIPANWALCDGTNGTPDLTNMFVVGAGDTYAVGDTGGADSVTLTEAQIPAHDHPVTESSAGGHNHTASTGSAGSHNHGGATGGSAPGTNNAGFHGHSGTANSAGSHRHGLLSENSTTQTNNYGLGNSSARGIAARSLGSGLGYHFTNGAGTQYMGADGTHSHSLSINGDGTHSHVVNNHTHSISTQAAHTHTVTVDSVAAHTHTVTVENTGGGGSHENRPPYYALAFIMNIG